MASILDIEIPKFVEWYYRCVDDKGHMSRKSHQEMCQKAGDKIHLWQKFLRQKDSERYARKETEQPLPLPYLPERFALGNEKETSCRCKADSLREDEDYEKESTLKQRCIIQ